LGECVNLQKLEQCFVSYLKRIILVFVGVLTLGIQNGYIRKVSYEPHLSDKARCSEASRFLITKIRYAYSKSFCNVRISSPSRGVTGLGGARGKNQVWRHHVRTCGISGANVLYWRESCLLV